MAAFYINILICAFTGYAKNVYITQSKLRIDIGGYGCVRH